MKFVSNGFGMSVIRAIFSIIFLACTSAVFGQTATNIQVTSTVQQASVNRLGVNLSDQTYWDSGQMLKNLAFQNPGFEGLYYRSILHCAVVTPTTCTDDNNFSPQTTGFWAGGTYLVISGSGVGKSGKVVSSTKNPVTCSGCGQIIQFDQSANMTIGDYVEVTTYFPGNGDVGWWDNISGGGAISTETTDLSPNTPGKQAVVLSASKAGQSAKVTQYFDSFSGLSFIQLNGSFEVTFRAKGVGGANALSVNVQRLQAGNGPYLAKTVALTNNWQDYTLTFSANETGKAVGTVQLEFGVAGSSVELDDVSLEQTNFNASNPTVFRDDVVNALKELNPGTIRMMAAGAALGSDIPNQLKVPFARYRGGFNTYSTSESYIAYGIHEFLQLCAEVGSEPWITIPTATTPAEMTDLIQYLTGNGSDSWSALRISRGQTQPWTSVFTKIHLELGNETWNGDFKGESMLYPGYPQWANQVFGAARKTSGFVASKFDLVLDGWAAVPGYDSIMLTYSTQHDSMDIAPYLLYNANNEPQSTMYGALFAEPEVFNSPGGNVYLNMQAASKAAKSTDLSVYETNLGTMIGTITQAQLDMLTPSVGAGLAHADNMLQMMRLGVKYQNAFALPQYEFKRGDGSLVKMWGLVVDMGTTNRRRPQFLTQALANSAIGGNMLQTVQGGANPTWNQPLSSDGVLLPGAHSLQSFAFLNGSKVSVVLFNLSQTTALPVTFSGPNAPTGTVQMTQITSSKITDNNETANVVQPTTKTLSAFNPATALSLPPFSMTVLSMSSGAVQMPNFSVPAGLYNTAQTVTITDQTPGASIYYTTDGSTPTASSTLYSGPVTISSSKTLSAMAKAPGLASSGVTTAAYEIGFPVVATPVFSLTGGTYSAEQTVAISDATAGATIYYTINGAVPTTGSTKYTAPIKVTSPDAETIKAIAVAANHNPSAVATASYSIVKTVATPTFSVAPGTYATAQTVAVKDATVGATMYYTTNGSTPTTSSVRYTTPFIVTTSETIKVLATAAKYNPSAIATAAYSINGAAAMPAFSVAPGSYASAQTVVLSVTTPQAQIYYTLNGTTPTISSTKYTTPIKVTASETIKAIAKTSTGNASAVATAVYTISTTSAAPSFSVPPGTYTTPKSVILSAPTAGAQVYFTLNGAAPSASSTKYTTPIQVTTDQTIKAIAKTATGNPSPVAVAVYTINTTAAVPTFSVAGGTYNTAQSVILKDATSQAQIYFTLNGATPTASSTKYTTPIQVTANETIKAIAKTSTGTASAVATAAYVISTTAASPTFSVAAGTYTTAKSVILTDTTPQAQIYFTLNGATPTASSTKYTTPIQVTASETVKAIAQTATGKPSPVATAAYVINTTAASPTFSVAAGTYTTAKSVILSDATPQAQIYFTLNGATPTASSTKYTTPIQVIANQTIKAIAQTATGKPSPVATAAYVINTTAVAPLLSVAAGTYTGAKLVALSDATPGAQIYYTLNGTTPTTASAKYTTPIKVTASMTLKAIAQTATGKPSALVVAAYTIK